MKNRVKNKFFNKAILFTSLTFLASSSVILIANKEQGIDLIAKEINNIKSKTLQSNIYNTAKVDPLYEVKTLRKVRSDKNAVNVLLLGDNYAETNAPNEFSDFCYTNVVVPWLSTQYPRSYEDYLKQTDLNRGTRNPFQTFLNDKINVYSIQPSSKFNNDIMNSSDSYFGMHTIPSQANSHNIMLSKSGEIKINVLSHDLTNNFLEDGAIATPSTVGMVRYGGSGRANASYYYRTTTAHGATTHIHEMGHSIWGLADEYGRNKLLGVNRAYISDPSNENDIPWKEFLNFRGIGLSIPKVGSNHYTPSHGCTMESTKATTDFCEVCFHQIIKRGVQITQQPYLYIADPQLIPSKNKTSYTDTLYSPDYLQQQELYKFKIDKGSNSTMDFRTVVDNLTTSTRRLKLRVYISGPGGIDETSEVFTINPGELKQLVLITKAQTGVLNKTQNTDVIGQVIDADTNEVLATNLDRLNYSYLSSSTFSNNVSYGKRIYKVDINFVDKNTNKPLPNVKPATLIKREGAKYKLEKILFNGYRLDEAKSKIDNKELTIGTQNVSYTYYYDALPYKTLKLKLLDQNNQQIQTKNVKVYEGQTFIPKSSDFFLYNLETFLGDSTENENWVNSISCPTETYTYDNIQNNTPELVYKISNEKPTYFNAKDIKIIQGDNLFYVLNSAYFKKFSSSTFANTYLGSDYDPSVIYNTVNTSVPGEYYVVFYFKNNFNIANTKHALFKFKVIVEPNKSVLYTPDELKSEKERLENYNILWLDKLEEYKGSKEDFESINQSNLLSNITNLNLNNSKYTYEVVDFSKLYPGVDNRIMLGYSFKIKISDKVTRASVITNSFDKYIWLKDDAPVTPPEGVVEVNNEITRINGLNLSLKKSILTQAEVNSINQQNILENVNGWVQTVGFAYEVVDFNNINNQFRFKIKALKNSVSITSKEFILSYEIKNEQNDETLIQQEINRINGLTLSLTKNSFDQNEINQIDISNFNNYISNWNSIILNANKYNYEIINFDKSNNIFKFNVKVTLINDSSLSKISNIFNLNYLINTAPVDPELTNEKDRIDQLSLSFNKEEFSQQEIDDILNNPNNIVQYLNNWTPSNDQFNYQYIVGKTIGNQLSLTIQIANKNNPDTYLSSKLFYLPYNVNVNNNQNNKNNIMPILLGTLIPGGIIVVAVILVLTLIKKRRKY